jgi:putative polyhydroxyalkanoate system protein
MAKLSIVRQHALSHNGAKEAAQGVADDLSKRFGLAYAWDGDCIAFSRAGLEGRLTVSKEQVALECQLGFLLSALKPAIEQEVHKEFDKRFGSSARAKR